LLRHQAELNGRAIARLTGSVPANCIFQRVATIQDRAGFVGLISGKASSQSLRVWRVIGTLTALLAAQLASQAGVVARTEKPLVIVSNPPPVRMLVPGFTVRELPLRVNNINNLVFAPDGRLFALCYDGNVLQLKDTDGDELEDTATHFYRNDKNEILPSIGMCWGPGGLYIASQGRVIRLRDQGDGTAELQTVTGGWVKPTGVAGSNLDAIGIAVSKAGEIFFGDQVACYKCHQVRGEGGTIGADLSNLVYRDYASVLKDIAEPSAAINPDHLAYNVELTDGSVETGVLLGNAREEVVLGQATGQNLRIPKSRVAKLKASAISVMPEGLLGALVPQQQKDLMTFLLKPPPAKDLK